MIVACVGGGSNAIGIWAPFVDDPDVKLVGAEAAGEGLGEGQKHAATLSRGSLAVFHGSRSYLLQDHDGQVQEAHSISAGLDYPGVGPEHAYHKSTGRVDYRAVTDEAAMTALQLLSETEGIIPALETAHAVALLTPLALEMPDAVVVLNCSGRGDKDMETITARLNG